MNGAGVPTFKHGDALGDIVQQEGYTMGLEYGISGAALLLLKWNAFLLAKMC